MGMWAGWAYHLGSETLSLSALPFVIVCSFLSDQISYGYAVEAFLEERAFGAVRSVSTSAVAAMCRIARAGVSLTLGAMEVMSGRGVVNPTSCTPRNGGAAYVCRMSPSLTVGALGNGGVIDPWLTLPKFVVDDDHSFREGL